MKNLRPQTFATALLLGLALACRPGWAAEDTQRVPGPLTLIRQVIDAFDGLGPATIQIRLLAEGPGHPKYVLHAHVKRNSPEQMAVTLTANGHVVREFVNGVNKVLYDETRRQFVSGTFAIRPDPVYEAVDLFRIALRDPRSMEPMRTAGVEKIVYEGKPAWRMKWRGLTPKTGKGPGPQMTLIAGVSDAFPYKISTVTANGATRVVIASVHREETPFTPETFTFVPPPYATRAGETSTEPPPAVPPADLIPTPAPPDSP